MGESYCTACTHIAEHTVIVSSPCPHPAPALCGCRPGEWEDLRVPLSFMHFTFRGRVAASAGLTFARPGRTQVRGWGGRRDRGLIRGTSSELSGSVCTMLLRAGRTVVNAAVNREIYICEGGRGSDQGHCLIPALHRMWEWRGCLGAYKRHECGGSKSISGARACFTMEVDAFAGHGLGTDPGSQGGHANRGVVQVGGAGLSRRKWGPCLYHTLLPTPVCQPLRHACLCMPRASSRLRVVRSFEHSTVK